MNKKLLTRTALNTLGVVAYVSVVATIMQNGDTLFGQTDTAITPVAVLLLFCVSAATVGSLVFGYPIMLFLDGKKREAVSAVGATIGWMMIATIAVFSVMILMR